MLHKHLKAKLPVIDGTFSLLGKLSQLYLHVTYVGIIFFFLEYHWYFNSSHSLACKVILFITKTRSHCECKLLPHNTNNLHLSL